MDEDSKHALKVKECNDEKSLAVLIEKHSSLCYNILQKFSPSLSNMGVYTDDLFREKDYLVYKAATTFNPDKKVKFSTWLGNYTRYHCLTLLSTKNRQISMDDEVLKFKLDKFSEAAHAQKEGSAHVKEFVGFLLDGLKDKRAKDVYMLRYFSSAGEKMTWKKIAKKMNISSQTAINIHNRAKTILKKKIKSKDIFDLV